MLRKLLVMCLPIFLFLLLFTQQARASTDNKSYSADQFAVSATIASGGTLDVVEKITFHFSGGPFTFVSRALPADNTDGVSILGASMDEQTMAEGTGSGQYEVKGDNPVSVTWHFSPQSDSSHVFTLHYSLQGVIQKSTTDLLDWKPLPTSHDYFIGATTITIRYPTSAALVSAPEVAQGSASVSQAQGQVMFQAARLTTNQSLEIGLRFRPGSLINTAPYWQQAKEQANALLPYLLGAGLLIFLVGSFLFIRHYRRYRRRKPAGLAVGQIMAPPGDLPPAMAGVLATTSDGSPTWNHALGTLFDLIDRNIVAVVPPMQGGWGAWFQGRPDFQLALINLPPDLRLHEAGLLKMLFRPEQGVNPVVRISQINKIYSRNSKLFSEPLKQEMTALGFFEPWRQHVRSRLGCTTGLMFVLSLVAVFMLYRLAPWPFIFLALGIMGISITTFFLWAMFSTYTDAAAQVSTQWEAFMRFMRQVTGNTQLAIGPELFARYLAYAASFGLLVPWAKALQRQGMIALPHWFRTLATANDAHNATDPTEAFLTMIETTHEMTHQSESSSGSNVGGSSGAAGGGSSSAG